VNVGVFAYEGSASEGLAAKYKVFAASPLRGDWTAQMAEGTARLLDSGCDCIVFIGKDCRPQPDLVDSHSVCLAAHRYPLVTCGRILHPDSRWKDFREVGKPSHLKLFNSRGLIIQNPSVLSGGYGISVANFGFNRAAADRLARFTRMYLDEDGPLPSIDRIAPSGYGKVLSICAWCARATVFMLPTGKDDAAVYGGSGPNPYSPVDLDNSEGVISLISKRTAEQPPGLDFFDSPLD